MSLILHRVKRFRLSSLKIFCIFLEKGELRVEESRSKSFFKRRSVYYFIRPFRCEKVLHLSFEKYYSSLISFLTKYHLTDYFFIERENEDFERRTRRRVSVSLGNGMRSDVMRRRLPCCEQHMYCMSISTIESCR